ncbi:MAG: DUF3299 domain-containing protein [Bacteroidota bacterium]
MIKKVPIAVLIMGGLINLAIAQTPITWIQLSQISFGMNQTEDGQFSYPIPSFPEDIKALNEKEVIIKGYMIPLNIEGTEYAISAFPNAACFFCGAAGQESVMRIEIKNSRRKYAVDSFKTFKGTLHLNYLPDDLLYILKEAEEVK